MSGFAKTNKDIFVRKMRKQIMQLLLISCSAFKEEMVTSGERLINDEGAITYRLIENYLNNDEFRRKNNLHNILLRFQPESPIHFSPADNGYIGRLDMQVISMDYLRDVKKYGVIECKRLDGSSELKRYYVNEGIERFVGTLTGIMKYPRHIGIDMMLGYLVADVVVDDTVDELNDYLERRMPGKVEKRIEIQESEADEWYYCGSSFWCLDNEKREIDHIFYCFEEIVEQA